MDNTVLRHIADKIDKEIEASMEMLAKGSASSYDDYKWRCGIIRGYLLAKGLMVETAEQVEGADD